MAENKSPVVLATEKKNKKLNHFRERFFERTTTLDIGGERKPGKILERSHSFDEDYGRKPSDKKTTLFKVERTKIPKVVVRRCLCNLENIVEVTKPEGKCINFGC